MNTLYMSEKLFERLEQTSPIRGYTGLLALYGLAQTALESCDEQVLKKCSEMLALYPDGVQHPQYTFEAYELGGNGKAYLIYKGYFEEHRDKLREYAEKTMKAPKDRDGILCFNECPEKEKIWIDVVTAVTPFMLYAGLALNEEKYIDFAAEQCFKMYNVFLDGTCGLLHQTKRFLEDPNLLSQDHWSRGNGWGYLGLADLVAYLPHDSKHRVTAEKYFTNMSRALIRYQTKRGTWRQEIPCDYSWEESSGTGLIAYGLGIGLRTGVLNKETYEKPYRNAIEGIVKYFINDDFSTNMCCSGCCCPGEGKEKGTVKAYLTEVWPQKDNTHSFGALMLALVEAYRNGITDIEK